MEIMISVNPPYSNMILNRYKPFVFRKAVLKEIEEETKAYIYETENKGGVGAIIGEVPVLGYYSLYYGDDKKPYKELVKERYFFIKEMYLYWCDIKGINPNMNEGWFKSKKFNKYQKEIGFSDDNDGRITCNYALRLGSPVLYKNARLLTEFFTSKGVPLNRPPQNMICVVSHLTG